MSKAQDKFDKVLAEWERGTLRDSHGTLIKHPKEHQRALAISFTEARKIDPKFKMEHASAKKQDGGKIKTVLISDPNAFSKSAHFTSRVEANRIANKIGKGFEVKSFSPRISDSYYLQSGDLMLAGNSWDYSKLEDGGDVGLENAKLKYAQEDIDLLEKKGDMAITDTTYGVLHGEYNDGVFEFNGSDFKNKFRGNKEDAIQFLRNAYTVEKKDGGKTGTDDELLETIIKYYGNKTQPTGKTNEQLFRTSGGKHALLILMANYAKHRKLNELNPEFVKYVKENNIGYINEYVLKLNETKNRSAMEVASDIENFFNKSELENGGTVTVETGYDEDVSKMFDIVADRGVKEPNLNEMYALSKKTAHREILDQFAKKAAKLIIPEVKESILDVIKNIKAGKYKSEFRFTYGGKAGDIRKVSATSSFFDQFRQAYDYIGKYKSGGKTKSVKSKLGSSPSVDISKILNESKKYFNDKPYNVWSIMDDKGFYYDTHTLGKPGFVKRPKYGAAAFNYATAESMVNDFKKQGINSYVVHYYTIMEDGGSMSAGDGSETVDYYKPKSVDDAKDRISVYFRIPVKDINVLQDKKSAWFYKGEETADNLIANLNKNKKELKFILSFGGSMEVGGKVEMKVTPISDIPNIKQKVYSGLVTYRGLGMGKLANDFYKIAGENGTRIKVDGKEYFITDTDFRKLNWDFKKGEWLNKIRFDAPFRKAEDGGEIQGKEYKNILDMPREERIEFINKTLKEDPQIIPKNGSYNIITEKTNEFIEHCFHYDREHPIITEHGDKIFFESIGKENDLASQVRYAAHFVTGDTPDGKRSYDSSKAEAIYFILPVLKEVEKIYHQPSNNRFVYTKQIRIGKYCCMVLDVETSIEGGLRSYTILPNQSYASIARKKASDRWIDASISARYSEKSSSSATQPGTKDDLNSAESNNKDTKNSDITKEKFKYGGTMPNYFGIYAKNGEIYGILNVYSDHVKYIAIIKDFVPSDFITKELNIREVNSLTKSSGSKMLQGGTIRKAKIKVPSEKYPDDYIYATIVKDLGSSIITDKGEEYNKKYIEKEFYFPASAVMEDGGTYAKGGVFQKGDKVYYRTAEKYIPAVFIKNTKGGYQIEIRQNTMGLMIGDEMEVNKNELISRKEDGGPTEKSHIRKLVEQEIQSGYPTQDPEIVWNAWLPKQRQHFLEDHPSSGINYSADEYVDFVNGNYDNLPLEFREKLIKHINEGRYEDGGKYNVKKKLKR